MKRKYRFERSTKKMSNVILLIVFFIPIVMYIVGLCNGNSLGDYVTALITYIGILLATLTFLVQFDFNRKSFQRQSKLNRDEFELNRNVFEFNRVEFEKQNEQNRRSDAMNSFYKMLECHNAMIGQMSIKNEDGNIIQGRQVFDVILGQYKMIEQYIAQVVTRSYSDPNYKPCYNGEEYTNFHICIAYAILYYGDHEYEIGMEKMTYWFCHVTEKVEMRDVDKTRMAKSYRKVLDEFKQDNDELYKFVSRSNRSLLSAYIKSVYNVIHFIHNNEYIKDDKEKLILHFYSQVSDTELFIWYYHIQSQIKYNGWNENFEDYMRKYQLLKDIPFGLDYRF